MFGQTPNSQWGAQGGYSRPPFNPNTQVSQTQGNSWSNPAPANPLLSVPPSTNWSRPGANPPNVAPIAGQTWPNTSVMPPRIPGPNKPRPTELVSNNTFSGQSNNSTSWSQPLPLLNRKRPLPTEDGDFPNNNFTRPRSGPWPKSEARSDDWSTSDARPSPRSGSWAGSDNRADGWSNTRPRPTPPLDTWTKPTPRNDTWSKPNSDNWTKPNAAGPPWSKPNADRPGPPWSKPNADTWSKPNSDGLPNKPRPNSWTKPDPQTRFAQKPFTKFGRPGFSKGEGNMHARPKPKSVTVDPRSVFDSIVTTYYVNQEKVNMPKELTSQFEPLKCGLCGVLVNSTVTAKTHYSGKMHDKKVVQFMQKWCAEKGQPLPEQFKEGVSRKQATGQFDEVRTLYCSVCDIPLTSKQHAEQHYMGKSHKRALDGGGVRRPVSVPTEMPDPTGRFKIGLEFIKRSDPLGLNGPDPPNVEETVKPKLNTNPFVCQLCSVSTTSKEQLDVHLSGARHRKKLGAAANPTPAVATDKQKIPPPAAQTDTILATVVQRPKPVVRTEAQDTQDEKKPDFSIFRTPSGQFYCAYCNVTMNSESQFGQHNDSKRHKLSVANNKGKNPTPNSTGTPKPVVKSVQQ